MSSQQHSVKFSNALILQGDWEGGLANFALDLMDAGKQASKVIFHAGDWIYKWKGVTTVSFDAPIELFEDWLRRHISENKIDCLILYNQYRPYNAIGWKIAKELNLECIVLELGLLRPDFCTIYTRNHNRLDYLAERWHSILAEKKIIQEPEKPDQLSVMSTPCKILQLASYYSFSRFISALTRKYTHYEDQRSLNFFHHLAAGIRGSLRFLRRKNHSRFNSIFSTALSGKYYFIPLQINSDSQVAQHSSFQSIEEFIRVVVDSFIKHAPSDTKLVFKVHPMDRGYKDYQQLINSLQTKPEEGRILYLDRIHLPTTLKHARACITINSSVGLSALIHHTPVLTLGEAAYNLEGLTYQGMLDEFWVKHDKVNTKLVKNFVALLKLTSQGQGTLFQRLYSCSGRCKIAWPEEFKTVFTNTPLPVATNDQTPSPVGASHSAPYHLQH